MFSAMIKGFTEDKGVIDFIHAVWAKSDDVRQNSLEEVRRRQSSRQREQNKLRRVAFS